MLSALSVPTFEDRLPTTRNRVCKNRRTRLIVDALPFVDAIAFAMIHAKCLQRT